MMIFIGVFLTVSVSGQKSYFQQEVNYQINVSLNDQKHELNGSISIDYKNNSNDTLLEIKMHLWPNAYKDRNTALARQLTENGRTGLYFSEAKNRGYIDSTDFKINDQKVNITYHAEFADIITLKLNEPLFPGAAVTINSPFRVKIPSGRFSRLGHIGESYQIVQWYPKPAVYDKNGWNEMPYLDQGEFYSEYGTFEVTITLPENYVVAATGNLMTPAETSWLAQLAAQTKTKTTFDSDNSFPESSAKLKTITYKQTSVHDFAWFADKRFHVLKGETTLSGSGKKISTWAFFTNSEPQLWMKSLDYIRDGLQYYSARIGDYPHASYTAIDGTSSAGEGMEYPMITIIGESGDDFTLEDVIVHEVGHSWFFDVIGFNERNEGWLDEGINSYYELAYIRNKYPAEAEKGKHDLGDMGFIGKLTGINDLTMKEAFSWMSLRQTMINADQAINTRSDYFTRRNSGAIMYRRTALAFEFLNDYLGESLFDSCMHKFYVDWQFQHPDGSDLRKTFEQVSGKNLDWFFDDVIATTKPSKFRIKKVNYSGDKTTLTISNTGKYHPPLKISGTVNQSPFHQWVEPFSGTKEIIIQGKEFKPELINEGYEAALKSTTASYHPNKLFKKIKPLSIRPLTRYMPDYNRTTLYVSPLAGWNNYNKFMAGIYLSNFSLTPVPFEFSLAPLFDFNNSEIAGMGNVSYGIYPRNGAVSQIRTTITGKRFAFASNNSSDEQLADNYPVFNYERLTAMVKVEFRPTTARSPVARSIAYRNIQLSEDQISYARINDSTYSQSFGGVNSYFNELTFTYQNSRTLDPYKTDLRFEQGRNHLKASLTFNYKLSYAKFNKGIHARVFAGAFIYNNEKIRNYNFRMSSVTGYGDYLYDDLYLGRTEIEDLPGHQFTIRDGGFKIPTAFGQTNKWLAAINLIVDLPTPAPLALFVDAGTYEGIGTIVPDITNKLMYDGGVAVIIARDILEVYVPLFKSKDITRNLDTNGSKFIDQIRFVLNLNNIAPAVLRKKF